MSIFRSGSKALEMKGPLSSTDVERAKDASVGALIGATVGSLIGGAKGAAIGGAVGGAAGVLLGDKRRK